jgi:hypothetical protein
MLYVGAAGSTRAATCDLGLARSRDGRTWEPDTRNPVPRGALVVLLAGFGGLEPPGSPCCGPTSWPPSWSLS